MSYQYHHSPSSSSTNRSTAARVGPRQTGPPGFVPTQKAFVLDVLRQAGSQGISKDQFREGTHPLLHGRKVTEIAARVCELEDEGYFIEHPKGRARLVLYILRGEPTEPRKPVQSAPRPGWQSQDYVFGKQAQTERPTDQPGLFDTRAFVSYETGVRR